MLRIPQPSPGVPDPLRLDPELVVRDTGCRLVVALEQHYRAVGTPHDVHRQIEAYRQQAHQALDQNLDGLVRRVEDGVWFPADRPLCVVHWGQR
jgi:hypothetical protein